MTPKEKVEYYSFLHKQNLNGRETEDELFEAGILVGIEESAIIAEEFAIGFAEWLEKQDWEIYHNNTARELLEIYKKGL
jgi:hypothetical protein